MVLWRRWVLPLFFILASACSLLQPSSVADWEPAPGADLSPDSQTVEIVVRERQCASGDTAEGRIQRPDVDYRPDAVVVTVKVREKGGSQNCPGNPLTPFTLELDEPLGNRELLDGGRGEPRPPSADT